MRRSWTTCFRDESMLRSDVRRDTKILIICTAEHEVLKRTSSERIEVASTSLLFSSRDQMLNGRHYESLRQ